MIELLSLLGGGLLRLLPELIAIFKTRQSNNQQLELAKLQMQADAARDDRQLTLYQAKAKADEAAADMSAISEATKAQSVLSGVRWVDAISVAVRPVLTYYWCIALYGSAKIIGVVVAFQAKAPLATFVPLLISEFDRNVIASLISFWFVDRALRRMQ